MNTSTTYQKAGRNARVGIATVVAVVAAAVMIVASIGAEVIGRGGTIQTGADYTATCQAARDLTLPIQLQSELQVQCAEQTMP